MEARKLGNQSRQKDNPHARAGFLDQVIVRAKMELFQSYQKGQIKKDLFTKLQDILSGKRPGKNWGVEERSKDVLKSIVSNDMGVSMDEVTGRLVQMMSKTFTKDIRKLLEERGTLGLIQWLLINGVKAKDIIKRME